MSANFPAVQLEPITPKQTRASALLRLTAILPLRARERNERFSPEEEAHRSSVSFVRAVAAWTSCVLELRTVFRPNLGQPAAGKTEIYLALHEYETPRNAKRALLARFRSLDTLLQAYYPAVVMVPVVSEVELAEILHPNVHGQGWAIQRNQVRVDLSQIGTPAKLGPVGFGASATVKTGPEVKATGFDYVFPWLPSLDSWRAVSESLHLLSMPSYLTVRLRPVSPESARQIETYRSHIEICEGFQREHGAENPLLAEQARVLRQAIQIRLSDLNDCSVDLSVTLTSEASIDSAHAAAIGDAITAGVVSQSDRKEDRSVYLSGGYDIRIIQSAQAMAPEFHVESQPFTAAETASAFRFPFATIENRLNLPVRLYKTSVADLDAPQPTDLFMGMNEHRKWAQPIGIPLADRLRHTYVVGMTGCGKSTLLESMILQDIYAGRGVAFIDPHGETVDSLLGKIPRERIEDVLLIDPLDYDRPIGFNLIACKTDFERDFIVGQFWEVFDSVYNMPEHGGPMFEQYMRMFLGILMGDDGKRESRKYVPTVLDIDTIFWDKKSREFLQEGCEPERIKDFMRIIDATSGEHGLHNMGPWVLSKFGRFLHDKALARMVGQSRNTVDFDSILREKKIVFFKLGKGRFAGPVCDILAGMFVARLLNAVFARSEMEASKRSEYFLYVDEFQNLVSNAFGEMLAEARKYKLGLVLAHQYTDQLTRGRAATTSLLPAVLGNVGTIASFRVGAADAERLAPSFAPMYAEKDLINIPNYQAYVRTSIGGKFVQPFNITTQLPSVKYNASVAQAVREHSRNTYGRPVDEIDAEIKARKRWVRNKGGNDDDDDEASEKEITLEDLFK